MQIISQFAPLPLAQPEKGTAVAMGFFDGIPRFCLLFIICILIGITSLPQSQRDISISDLYTRVANITQI